MVGLDFQVQVAAISTNPTVLGSNEPLSALSVCSLEAWHERPLDSVLSDEAGKRPNSPVTLRPCVPCRAVDGHKRFHKGMAQAPGDSTERWVWPH